MNSILLHVMPAEVLELTPSEIQRVFVDETSERADSSVELLLNGPNQVNSRVNCRDLLTYLKWVEFFVGGIGGIKFLDNLRLYSF